MHCELCGNQVERRFEVFIPVKDKEDERVVCCGQCKMLTDINDNLKALASLAAD